MNGRSQIRVGVVGCGNWGKNLVRNFSELGVLAGVCDIDSDAAKRHAMQFAVPDMSIDEMLSSPGIDAVAIAVLPEDHATLSIRAMKSDKHVFVEKPLAVTNPEAEAMVRAARRHARILMVGHLLRFHPCFVAMLESIESGRIGRPRYVYSVRADNRGFRREENALWGFAPHDVSMILALTGETPSSVTASGSFGPKGRGADIAAVILEFSSGLNVHMFISWFNHIKEQKLVVAGENGVIVFDDREPWHRKLVVYDHRHAGNGAEPWSVDGTPLDVAETEPLKEECKHFIRCVETGQIPLTDCTEGADVVGVLSAITESMRSGMPAVPVNCSGSFPPRDERVRTRLGSAGGYAST